MAHTHIYNEILFSHEKDILPFGKTWMDLESIMLSEKYHIYMCIQKYHLYVYFEKAEVIDMKTRMEVTQG